MRFKQTLSGMFTADWYFEYTAPGIDKARALEGALPKLASMPVRLYRLATARTTSP